MAIALSGTPVLSNSGGTTATSTTATLASTTVGDLNIIAVSANTSGTGVDPAQSMPAGWTAVPGGSSGKTGTPYHRLSLFYRFFQAGDTNPTVTIAALGNIECAAVAYSGVDSSTPFVSGEVLAQPQGASSTSWSTGSITTAALRWIISVFGNRSNGTWSALTDTQRLTGIVASSANIAYEDTNGTVAAGTITARTATFSVATSVGNTVIVALNPASSGGTAAAGSAALTLTATATWSEPGTASLALTASGGWTEPGTATLTLVASGAGAAPATASAALALTGAAGGPFATGSAAVSLTGSSAAPTAAATGSAALSLTASGAATGRASGTAALTLTASATTPIVRQLLTGGIQWPAHRNGTYATYGEETLEGYTAALAQYSKAILEISVWDTSDGVYVCSHDQTTSRVFSGTNYTITSTTWATLSPNGTSTVGRPTTIVGGNPMRRLEEILDAFPSALFLVENKHGTNEATLATLLDSHAAGRWMFKGPYNDTANAVIAAGHGAPMWLYFYPSQLGSLSTTYSAVSGTGVPIVFGLGDYSTAPVPVQSDATTFFSFTTSNGLMAWAHILGTTTQKTTADGQASTAGSAFNGYMTSSYPTLAPNDSGTATASLTLTASGAAAAPTTATASLTLTGTGGARASGTGTATLTLTGSGGAPAASGTAALALTATGSGQGASGGTASLSLVGSGGPPSVSGTASLLLTGTANATAPATGTAQISLTGAATAAAPITGTAVLTLAASGSGRGAVAGTASVTFTASAVTGGGSSATGTALLTLAATVGASALGGGAAALGLTGSAAYTTNLSGTAVIIFTAAATPSAAALSTASLTLTATGQASAPVSTGVPPFTVTGSTTAAVVSGATSSQAISVASTTGVLVTVR